jgi:uncharacterized membrane protein YcaP (DUF421 family)
LRWPGHFSLDQVRYVLYETNGSITVVPAPADGDGEPRLVRARLAAG